jgi:hypothetical protein
MSSTYIIRDGAVINKRTGQVVDLDDSAVCAPLIVSDLPEYISPVTRKPIEGRAARREDLKRSGCREVDPSEYKPVYRSDRFKHLNTER